MSTKDVSDFDVCRAVAMCREDNHIWPYELLAEWTGQPEKVCYRAMERSQKRGLIEYGVSLRTAWLTERGAGLLKGEFRR